MNRIRLKVFVFILCASAGPLSVLLTAEDVAPKAIETTGVDEASRDEIPIDEYDRDHWAYQRVVTPEIPVTVNRSWPRTNIDAFILSTLEAKRLQPAPEANRETLIRRLSFDLIGLPPTVAQLDAFLSDDRPGAYRRLVDRLLASPQYGRRWGQYWLDLARFAETDGFEHDKIRKTAWQYRDWVIQALCDDLPYDEFVSLQIAGDVIRPDQPNATVATAFCLSGPDMPDINSQEERKHVLMNEVTSTVGAVLISMQVGCAQCHDHKYDAISQADFYRLRAFFDPAVKLKLNQSVTVLGNPVLGDTVSGKEEVGRLPSRMYLRGDWRNPGPIVNAAFPRIVNLADMQVDSEVPSGKRESLAHWLTDESNPLTSRSIVNRIWQFHFGSGFTRTPSDFGLMGDDPSHPELLDYLASRLMREGWSLKRLHREIVMSSVYRTSGCLPEDSEAASSWQRMLDEDPDNRWLARFPRRRLDAEAIRDAILASSGSLNPAGGGPGVSPPLPIELVKTLKSGQWKVSEREADHHRRSIYIFARRNLRYPLFATFDRPAANCSCAIRHPSTTALQSLLLLNSKVSLAAATCLAERVDRASEDRGTQCELIYRRVLSRSPSGDEVQLCLRFLDSQTATLKAEGQADAEFAALTDFCLAMFNSNQFLYVD